MNEKNILKDAFESLADAVVLVDESYNIIYVNKSAAKTFNTKSQGLVGRKYYEVIYGLDHPMEGCPLVVAEKTLRPYSREISSSRISGAVICSAALILGNDGKLEGYSLILRDITKWKRQQRQLAHNHRMEAVSALSKTVAHEVNNLLMGIQGMASLALAMLDKKDSIFEKVQRIEQYTKRGHELTKQLLGFSAGSKYDIKPIDLNRLVEESAKTFASNRKDVAVLTRLQEKAWRAKVDAGQIEQVLLNFYANAWQAMPEGGELNIETENVMFDQGYAEFFGVSEGPYVKVSVTDTGVGMDQTTQEAVFEPFFTTRGNATGLGLAFAKRIVDNHGGVINLYSTKGVGTTFNIYLPAITGNVVELGDVKKDVLKGSETILLVDDEKMILEVGEEMLEEMGYSVFVARNGSEAVDIYESRQDEIDLVILDMIMPGMGGSEVFDRLQEINPQVKVVLASGYSVTSQVTNILNRGCRGFMQKPFNMGRLSHMIRDVVDSR